MISLALAGAHQQTGAHCWDSCGQLLCRLNIFSLKWLQAVGPILLSLSYLPFRCGQSICKRELLHKTFLDDTLGFRREPILCRVIHWTWILGVHCLGHAARTQAFVEISDSFIFSWIVAHEATIVSQHIWITTGSITIISEASSILSKSNRCSNIYWVMRYI